MHKVDSWHTANKLTLNTKKTKGITFITRDSPPVPPNLEIMPNGNALDKVTSIRFFGETVHKHLTWKSHVELLLKKIRMGRNIMQKVKPYLNLKLLQLLYCSMIQTHFQYCFSSRCFNSKTLIHRFQNTTNKAIRLAFNAKKDDIKAVMKKHNIMTTERTVQLEIVKFMHKYFIDMLPDAFNNFFQHNHRNCDTARSRSKAKVFPKFCRIKLIQQSFKYKGPVQ